MKLEKASTIAIIGAGISGLATAKQMLKQGYECTVYERRSELGGVWADGYAGFGVQVQKDLYQFPDYPLPEGSTNFTPGPEFRSYLEGYCDTFGIRECLRLSTEITSVQRNPSGGWLLKLTSPKGEEEIKSDYLVIATGLYSETPEIPDIPGRETFAGEVLHSSEVKSFGALRDQNVAVIGYGKSASDIAAGAVPIATSVNLIFRQPHWPVPRKLLGILPFKWGMLTRLIAALIPPYVRPSPAVKFLHSIGKPLPWLLWRIVELLLRTQQGLGMRIENGKTLIPEHGVLYDAYSERTMVPRPGFFKLIWEGKIRAHRSSIKEFTENGLRLSDGTSIGATCVVFGTGWKTSNSFLPGDVRLDLDEAPDGIYLYRHILHPSVPDLAYVGKVSTFMSATTYALQARWLGEVLAGQVELPPPDDMLSAIRDLKTWKRSWMPESPARSGTLLLHMSQYHDELLCDLGEDPLRKSGILAPLKEVLVPYQASDFREVV